MTYPKDNDRRLRETIRQLKTEVGRLRKRERVLMDELTNVMKPARPRKEHVEDQSPKMMTQEEWRQDFMKKFKPSLEKHLKEIGEDGEDKS